MARLIGAFRQTIEVRPDEQVTKARWVRVELLKIESLPGGGNQNTYSDHVGSSPVKIWAAEGEWDVLGSVSATSRDAFFCVSLFFSKISHSPYEFPNQFRRASNLTREVREFKDYFPRTPAHNHSAGIRYVLTATLCLRSKRCVMFCRPYLSIAHLYHNSHFFFRNFFKPKDVLLATSHSIIIDKHELHSTWPVYSQPESRHVVEDLLMLTVDRSHTCYGPGDRVKVLATFKNDGIPAMALRTLEFLLKETIIFRPGATTPGKKRAPQCHVTPIGEQKEPINVTIYQGQQYAMELGCFIPQTHTNTTVVAARHIDIGYSIEVKAVLGTGKPLLMELPVTVSNWPR